MLKDEPTLCPGFFRLPDEPVGPRILVPGFRAATSVRGAFGWFSSGWIARLAPGLAVYLNRTDTAPIEFTVAPALFASEAAAIDQAYCMTEEEAAHRVAGIFTHGKADASALGCHAMDCLSWMIATAKLRLRVAVPTAVSNYHPKIWAFDDSVDQVVARGSGNATGRGVSAGVEHIDVDVSWQQHSRARVTAGIAMLDAWSRGQSRGIARVVDLPDALKEGIIDIAPNAPPNEDDYRSAAANDGFPRWAYDAAAKLRERFARTTKGQGPRLTIPDWLNWETGPYAHQGEAVAAWEGEPDPERGTVAMATGAGKTLTALVCATRVQDQLGDVPLLVVVSAPSIPLVIQWIGEAAKFGVEAVAPSIEADPNVAITNLFRRLTGGGTHVLITTNAMLCSQAFQSTVSLKLGGSSSQCASMIIGDEAHTLGAEGFVRNKPEFFEKRLALSATPERQYDPDGTEEIFAFFGPPVYEFGLERAIGFCLAPYNYYVHTGALDGEELEKFEELSARIGAAMGQGDDEEAITRLLIARRRIIETAQMKIALLKSVLERRAPRKLKHALVYASAKNPEQFEQIAAILTDLDIRWAPVTQDTTSNTKFLQRTLGTFAEGGYQVLLAKKVLDEGVDIPSIREAFIVASSTVQREWVQRRGRVLRLHPDKPWAIVHDFLALPPAELVTLDSTASMKKIITSELDRAYSFAAHARNAAGADGVMEDLQRVRSAYWPDHRSSSNLVTTGQMLIASQTPEGAPW